MCPLVRFLAKEDLTEETESLVLDTDGGGGRTDVTVPAVADLARTISCDVPGWGIPDREPGLGQPQAGGLNAAEGTRYRRGDVC